MCEAVLDTGATHSIVASSLVSDPNRRGYCALKVGDGHYTYREKSVDVCMGNFNLPHVCIVMETSAFQVCLGMNFIRQNAKTILGLIFTPPRLIVKNPESDKLSLVSLSEKSCQKEARNGLPPAQSSLKISLREAYSLLPSQREQVLINLGDLRPSMDLYANPRNHTEPLYYTPLNSCYAYNCHNVQLCWANPPSSHLEKMVTKAVLDRAQVVVICPDWGQTGEAAAWRPIPKHSRRLFGPNRGFLDEVDLEDAVLGGVQNFTMSRLAVLAIKEYGVPMQVEEDEARIANPRGWPVSKDDLRSLKEDIELRIFQISEEQQGVELKDRWKSHYNESTGSSVDGNETDLFYQYLDDDRFIMDGNDVYLDVSAPLSECYSVSRDEYGKSNLAAADDFEEKIKNLPSKIQEVPRRRNVALGPFMAHGS